MPTPNLYQALHTGVSVGSAGLVRVIILSTGMDRYNKQIESNEFKNLLYRIEGAQRQLGVAVVPVSGLEGKLAVRTPKQAVILLDTGATVLDFAHRVHSEIAATCIGASINGLRVPPDYPLSDNDEVRVLTDASVRPDERWIEWAHLQSTRRRIRKSLAPGRAATDRAPARRFGREAGLMVKGAEDAPAYRAGCCHPVFGEPIVGYLTRNGRVAVHRSECAHADHVFTAERRVEVEWIRAGAEPFSDDTGGAHR